MWIYLPRGQSPLSGRHTLGFGLAVVCALGVLTKVRGLDMYLHRFGQWFDGVSVATMAGGLVIVIGILLVVAFCMWLEQRDERPARHVDRVKAYLGSHGLGSLPLHGGNLYPTTPSTTAPAWPGPRKPVKPRIKNPHSWHWIVAEHLLIAFAFGAFMPTLLVIAGQTAGAGAGASLVRMWFAVAADWWQTVFAAAAIPTTLYAGYRVRTWSNQRHRRSVRARRTDRMRRHRIG